MVKNDDEERKKLSQLIKDALYDLKGGFTPEKVKAIDKLVSDLKAMEEKAGVKNPKWVLYADQLKLLIKKQQLAKKKALKKLSPAMKSRKQEPLPEHMVS